LVWLHWACRSSVGCLKGGAAVTGNSFDILTDPGNVSVASANATRWGAAVGVGAEYGFTPNWSVGLEYDHLFMGNSNNSLSVANSIVAGALNRVSQDVGYGHYTLQLPLRLGQPGRRPLLISLLNGELEPRSRPGLFY
jgi:outer membrane immunogenic protein